MRFNCSYWYKIIYMLLKSIEYFVYLKNECHSSIEFDWWSESFQCLSCIMCAISWSVGRFVSTQSLLKLLFCLYVLFEIDLCNFAAEVSLIRQCNCKRYDGNFTLVAHWSSDVKMFLSTNSNWNGCIFTLYLALNELIQYLTYD